MQGWERLLLWGSVVWEPSALEGVLDTGEKKSRILFFWGFMAEKNRGVVMSTGGVPGRCNLATREARRLEGGCPNSQHAVTWYSRDMARS
jgi:hypothetical protein